MYKSAYFSYTLTKNCRKYIKFCYQLQKRVDRKLLLRLERFGLVEIYSFAKFIENANDTFRILVEDDYQISGVLDDTVIHLALAKEGKLEVKELLECELVDWIEIESLAHTDN